MERESSQSKFNIIIIGNSFHIRKVLLSMAHDDIRTMEEIYCEGYQSSSSTAIPSPGYKGHQQSMLLCCSFKALM